METITGEKCNTKVYADELHFLYIKTKVIRSKTYLRCYSQNCKGRAIQEGSEYSVTTAHDLHPNHRSTIVKLRFRDRLREAVIANPEILPATIFEQQQLLDHEAADLVSREDVRNLIAKTRLKLIPPIPVDLRGLGASLDTER